MAKKESYRFPAHLYYTEGHLWVKVELDRNVKIGLDDLAQKLMGKITFIQLPKVGSVLQQNEDFATIESIKCAKQLNAPVSGSIIEVNDILRLKPELINADPYGEGWIARVKPTDKLMEELESLIHGDAVSLWLKREK